MQRQSLASELQHTQRTDDDNNDVS